MDDHKQAAATNYTPSRTTFLPAGFMVCEPTLMGGRMIMYVPMRGYLRSFVRGVYTPT